MSNFKAEILNIIQEAGTVEYKDLEKKLLNKYPYKSEFELQDMLDTLQGTNKIRNKQGVLSIVHHNPVNEVVEAEAPITNDKNIIINDKICYLSKDDNKIHLNWYNPKAEAYEQLLIYDKKESLNWLTKFKGPETAEEFQKVLDDNNLLWDSIGIDENKLINMNKINKLIKDVDKMNKENKTNKFIGLLNSYNFVICKNNNELYRFDENKGAYIHYDYSEYLEFVEQKISSKLQVPLISSVVKVAYDSLRTYKYIHHNILAFKNGYYNTDTWEFKESIYTDGIPYYTFDYNYNPNAEPDYYFNHYWGNYDDETQLNLLEVIGLLLLKGNPLKKLWFIVGTSNSGKTVFINILISILKKTSNLDLETINKNGHERESLLDSNVNIMNDEAKAVIKQVHILKQFTGNDDLYVNPKNKRGVTLKGNDVPKLVGVFNNLPTFKELEEAMQNRLGVIILNTIEPISKPNRIRQLEDLIVKESSSIEWLLFNALEKAKFIIDNKSYIPSWDLEFKDSEELNNILIKHSQPIRYFLEKGFAYTGEENNFKNEYIETGSLESCVYVTEKEMNMYLDKASELEKVQISERTSKGNVKPKVIKGFINDIFGVTNYDTKRPRVKGERTRVYYCLDKTEYYDKVMNS